MLSVHGRKLKQHNGSHRDPAHKELSPPWNSGTACGSIRGNPRPLQLFKWSVVLFLSDFCQNHWQLDSLSAGLRKTCPPISPPPAWPFRWAGRLIFCFSGQDVSLNSPGMDTGLHDTTGWIELFCGWSEEHMGGGGGCHSFCESMKLHHRCWETFKATASWVKRFGLVFHTVQQIIWCHWSVGPDYWWWSSFFSCGG